MDKRPDLPELKPGDRIIAKACSPNALLLPVDRQVQVLVITRIATTYLYAVEEHPTENRTTREWAFNRKTQDQKARQYSPDWRFVTAEQDRWDTREELAKQYLREAGISYTLRVTPRYSALELANIIRRHEGLEEL